MHEIDKDEDDYINLGEFKAAVGWDESAEDVGVANTSDGAFVAISSEYFDYEDTNTSLIEKVQVYPRKGSKARPG